MLSVFFCIYYSERIFRRLIPGISSLRLTFFQFLFLWGGGLLFAAGFFYNCLHGQEFRSAFFNSFVFDPSHGTWNLNFGRNLFFPNEAFYHALFLAGIDALLARKPKALFLVALLLALSHPFTGIQFISIIIAYLIVEYLMTRQWIFPFSYTVYFIVLAVLHVGYHLFFLNSIPEHRKLFNTWSQDWFLEAPSFVPALALVAMLSAYSIYRATFVLKRSEPSLRRFWLCMFVITFLLYNHEWFMRPVQPIHFARGYDYTALFFFALPGLSAFIDSWRKYSRILAVSVLLPLSFLFCLDNFAWLSIHAYNWLSPRSKLYYHYLKANQQKMVQELCKPQWKGKLVLANDPAFSYALSVYTPLRTTYGHLLNSPDFTLNFERSQELARTGKPQKDESDGQHILVLSALQKEAESSLDSSGFRMICRHGDISLWSK
jgi:hypothetical protein